MKKMRWNTLIFLLCILVYLSFGAAFWIVFDNNELYWRYFDFALNIFMAACGLNTAGQIIAIFKREKCSILWLVIGIILFFITIAFTIGQSA